MFCTSGTASYLGEKGIENGPEAVSQRFAFCHRVLALVSRQRPVSPALIQNTKNFELKFEVTRF